MLSIPIIQTSTKMKLEGKATVPLWNGSLEGRLDVTINAEFNPQTTDYPEGDIRLKWNRPGNFQGEIQSKVIEQMSLGLMKKGPAVFVSGRGRSSAGKGCRYWIMISKETEYDSEIPDYISFLIIDNKGDVLAHGTGAVNKGNIKVSR